MTRKEKGIGSSTASKQHAIDRHLHWSRQLRLSFQSWTGIVFLYLLTYLLTDLLTYLLTY